MILPHGRLFKRQLSSGLAETIKHAVCLASSDFFEYLEKNIDKIMAVDKDVCEKVAEENCSIKYHVVMKDEKGKRT